MRSTLARRRVLHVITRDIVSDYLAWHVVVNGGDSILEALELRRGTKSRSGMPW